MDGLPLQVSGWPWYYVATYFFLGGIAAGSYMLATAADLWGNGEQDRPLIRTGYFIAFVCLLVCPILLIFDLGKPERFWHMLLEFKLMSPVSMGTWGLTAFGLFSALSAAIWAGIINLPQTLTRTIGIIGSLLAFFVAGYTGVLLSATTNPFWNSNPFLGITFLVSAISTAIAAIALILVLTGHSKLLSMYSLRNLWLTVLGFEIFLLVWEVLHEEAAILFTGKFFLTFVIAVGLVGVLIPLLLLLSNLGKRISDPMLAMTAILVLIGGFCFRYSILVAGQEFVGGAEHAMRLLGWLM